jgi:1-acyl-sn-glycerol-3-phosphate acyltransferase
MIRGLLVICMTLAYVLVVGTPVLIYSAISGNTDFLYRVGILGARVILRLAGVRLVLQGREKVPTQGAVVFMANHQGNCDPPAIFVHLPPVLVMVKKEFFRVPILGRGMRLRGFIPVDRQNRERAFEAVEQAVEALKAGHSFLVFPEGTRSRDGRLQPFKKGVFVMAIRAGAAIVPISISGSSKVMRKGEFAIHPGTVRLTFHDPVPTTGYTLEDREQVIALVRGAILKGLEKEEWPLESAIDQLSLAPTPPAASKP